MTLVAVAVLALSGATGIVRWGERATASAAEPQRSAVALVERPMRPADAPAAGSSTRARNSAVARALLVEIPRTMELTARPGAGPIVGTMPTGSRFYGQPLVAWVLETTADGRYGRVPVPYAGRDVTGWLPLRGLETVTTGVRVIADLSEHRIEVRRGSDVLLRAPAATGAAVSPTPPGRYFVTDRVAFPAGGYLGTFAFGISGIQSNLPPGWSGGDQLAIHGTNAPATIGTSSSAGCLRVSEPVLQRLRPLLRPGTPIVIVR